jgi:hypothetical protein
VRCLALAAPVLVAATWWFVLPLPGDLLMGALHREKFLGFVTGNSELARVAWEHRALHWTSSLVASPRAFVLLVIGLLVALHTSFTRGTRTLWLVALVFTVAITAHPFHLDRFLVPGGVVLFALSAIGLAALLPRSNPGRVALAALVGFLVLWSPSTDVEWFAERLGILARDDEPELARYKRSVLAGRQRLSPWRTLPTGGLPAAELDPLVDLVAAEVGPDECPGWIGPPAHQRRRDHQIVVLAHIVIQPSGPRSLTGSALLGQSPHVRSSAHHSATESAWTRSLFRPPRRSRPRVMGWGS